MKRLGGSDIAEIWGDVVELLPGARAGGWGKKYPYTIFRRGLLWSP